MSEGSKRKTSGSSGGSGGSSMNKKMILALVLVAITVIVLLFSGLKPKVTVDIIITSFEVYKSMAFLGFTLMGIIIGLMLK
jgi:hypothetical protein